ncbi:hypothetical protein DFH07DRAFT_782286 [Mycena maculata]|uniref:C2H2-type domain-containing protein n=1 Tax=Mycena maculata TaxID=230809 RepID=A0AAD7MQF5_9AGAR|nr:hypothetical protein DFH07DRAFT_782286 [Mycena maculata]
MSFSLPLNLLSATQISFKVGLPDGIFAFDMVPLEPQRTSNFHPPSGLKLNLRAYSDCNGVTLTLSTSGESRSPSNASASDCILEMSGSQPNGNLPSPHPFDLDFRLYCEDEQRTSGSWMLDLFPSDGPSALDHLLFQRMYLPSTDKILTHVKAVHNEKRSTNNQSTDSSCPPSYNIDIAQDFAFSAESDSTDSPLPATPSTSDSSRSPRPRSRCSKLRRSEPPCSQYFTTKPTSPKRPKVSGAKSTQLFRCTMGCTMDFSRKHDRLRHEVAQHGRVCEWGCETCQRSFSSEATLRKHKCKISGGAKWIGGQIPVT